MYWISVFDLFLIQSSLSWEPSLMQQTTRPICNFTQLTFLKYILYLSLVGGAGRDISPSWLTVWGGGGGGQTGKLLPKHKSQNIG